MIEYCRGRDLVYVARVRNGFVPAARRQVHRKLKPIVIEKCPFVNLPETGRARSDDLLDTEKMKKCVWVRSELVAVIEFLGGPREISCGIPSSSRSAMIGLPEMW